MARAERPRAARGAMTPARRRWGWVVGAALLVVILVGGRWAASQTAERLWAATIPGGAVYLAERGLAQWCRLAIFLLAVGWATINVWFVYRSIGSVQLPRRLGDLEILEAVPRRVLRFGTVIVGLLLGLALMWGTGDWWQSATLAANPPRYGLTDPILGRDLGYFVAVLPWSATLQNRVLVALAGMSAVAASLYVGIGSLAWREGRLHAGPYARLHLGLLLAGIAVTLAWGAVLDPAEVVGGMHGTPDRALLVYRLPAAAAVAGLAVAVATASLLWAWTGRTPVLTAAWGTFVVVAPFLYLALPAIARSAQTRPSSTAPAESLETRGQRDEVARLTALAFGWPVTNARPPAFPSPLEAARRLPLWDGARVGLAARTSNVLHHTETVAAVALTAAASPTWLLARAPDETALRDAAPRPSWDAIHQGDWARTGVPLLAVETDTGLVWQPAALRDTVARYGPGFGQFALLPRSAGQSPLGGIPMAGRWHRLAFAWLLQSPEIWRVDAREGATVELLWRRNMMQRLRRLAPFADFGAPQPLVVDSTLWWVSWGYVEGNAFPLVPSVEWRGRRVRYLRPGLLGVMNATQGSTRLYLAPGFDSLSAAWGRILAPLLLPPDSLPAGIRSGLGPPAEAFALAAGAWQRLVPDTGWRPLPREPFALLAPGPEAAPDDRPSPWWAQAYATGQPSRLAAILAAVMTARGPALTLWRPTAIPAPPLVLGTQLTSAGVLRVWPAGGAVVGWQAAFRQPAGATALPVVDSVYLSWGDQRAVGPTVSDVLTTFLAGGPLVPPGESGGRWARARRLLERADAALRAGNLELFAQLYGQLKQLFGLEQGPLAPPPRRD